MSSEESARAVDPRSIFLLDGVGGLRSLGLVGDGVVVGIIDYAVTAPDLEPYVAYRSAVLAGPERSVSQGHGDEMAGAVLAAAPGCRLAVANVEDVDGYVLRPTVAAGIEELVGTGLVRLINVSLWLRRLPERCTAKAPCIACRAATAAVENHDVIVVAAAGNLGAEGMTCPGAARSVVSVAATEGPVGSGRSDVPVRTVTGTSISAAMVTGGCALLLSAFPDLGVAELRQALAATATELPLAGGSVGAGRAHYFRAYRYIEHVRTGGVADPGGAQALVDAHLANVDPRTDWADRLMAVAADAERSRIREAVASARELAPWASSLWLAGGLLRELSEPTVALEMAVEAINLEWADPRPHQLLSRLLLGIGDTLGASVEADIGRLLADGLELQAADRLFDGKARRRAGS